MELTQALGRRIADGARQDIPPQVGELALTGIMDAIATAFAGQDEAVVRIALQYAGRRQLQHAAAVRLPWLRDSLPAPMAALVFGTAVHALDYDDVALGGHPSTVLVPVILCEALSRSLSGRECLRAYATGYQVWAELFLRESDPLHPKGWHPTAVYGVIAGAAALACLRGLDADQAAAALSVASSLASGMVANFGTMTKPLHAGRAASLAFDALEFVDLGLSAAPDALEHRAGFLHAISPAGRVDRMRPVQADWHLGTHGLCIKKYPVCYSSHRIIDAVIAMAREHDLSLDQVERAEAGLGPSQLSMLRNARPQTALEAKFSLQFAIAAAIDARAVGLVQLDDEYVRRPAMQAFYERVAPHVISTPDEQDPTFSAHDEVTLVLRNGSRLRSGPVRAAAGHASMPLTRDELRRKFDDCVARHPPPGLPGPVLAERLLGLPDCPDAAMLFLPA